MVKEWVNLDLEETRSYCRGILNSVVTQIELIELAKGMLEQEREDPNLDHKELFNKYWQLRRIGTFTSEEVSPPNTSPFSKIKFGVDPQLLSFLRSIVRRGLGLEDPEDWRRWHKTLLELTRSDPDNWIQLLKETLEQMLH